VTSSLRTKLAMLVVVQGLTNRVDSGKLKKRRVARFVLPSSRLWEYAACQWSFRSIAICTGLGINLKIGANPGWSSVP
jgi:hypothetical protein